MKNSYEDLADNGNQLVSVRAQVMVRDDSSGGWVPLAGGGLSNISVRKRTIPCDFGEVKNEYHIFGNRVSDESVVLHCAIKKDFEYYKVMPTFHHWKTDDKRFGLTFQTAADARAFDKGVRTAVDEFLDGISMRPHGHNKHGAELSDDETVKLPVHEDPRSSSDSSAHNSPETSPQDQVAQISVYSSEQDSPGHSDKYPFLQTADHDYEYADVEDTKLVEGLSGGKKKKSLDIAPSLPPKSAKSDKQKFGRHRCRYCQEFYVEEENSKGVCEYAPDFMRTTIDELACVRCARCMLYHCMSDEEGDFAQHPCDCNGEEGCGRRWMGLGLLSIFVPCLWLYPPLRACHWCCVHCGLCGGRHRPAS